MVSASCVIRAATIDDAEAIAHFNVAMARETEGLDLDPVVALRGATAVLEDGSKGRYFVVCDGAAVSQIIAQAMCTYEWSDWRAAQVWWIQSVFVVPQWRQQGHFRRLYAHVRAAALRQGAAGLRLYAHTANSVAQQTYLTLGMSSGHYDVWEDMF